MDDDDICRNNHGGNAESEDANALVEPHKSVQRGQIFQLILKNPKGIHCEAIEQQLHMRHQTASARLSEMKRARVIYIIGYTTTTSGARARLYAARDTSAVVKSVLDAFVETL